MYARVCDRIREIGKGSCGGYGLCPLLKHVFSLSLFSGCVTRTRSARMMYSYLRDADKLVKNIIAG